MRGPADWLRSKADRIFRRLLSLYPDEFRADYGPEMTLLFEDRSREEPVARLLWDVVKDTAHTAPKEHLDMIIQDLKYATRMLVKSPAFTAVAVLSLALGIGANTAIFSLADAMLLRPLAVPDATGLFLVQGTREGGSGYPHGISHPDFMFYREKNKSFTDLMASTDIALGFAAKPGDQPRIKLSELVSGNFLDVMGVKPALGRSFRAEEDSVPGRDAVVVLSHDAWTNLFSTDPTIVGRKIRLNGIDFTIIGVIPQSFTGLRPLVRPDFYVPLMMSPALLSSAEDGLLNNRRSTPLSVRGRLKPGVTQAVASAEIDTLSRNLAAAFPATNEHRRARVRTEFQQRVDQSPPDATIIGMLMTIVSLVLLIACANVANLLLGRSRARAREIAVRLAIGANGGRLLRQLLTESLLLALLGGLVGLLFAEAGVRFFSRIQIPTDVPVRFDLALDQRVLLFSLAASIVSAVLFGFVPALRSLRPDLVGALKAGELDQQFGSTRRFGRNLLVGAQLALSCVLLIAAAMMIAGIRSNMLHEPGFRRDNVLMMAFEPRTVRYTEEQTARFYRNLLDRAQALPGVRSAALGSTMPTANEGAGFATLYPEGYQMRPEEKGAEAFRTNVSEGYFETLGIPILRGRGFLRTDTKETKRVAVVNETFAARYWPNQDPIGRRMRREGKGNEVYEVVGLARNSKYFFIAESPIAAVYFATAQHDDSNLYLFLHTDREPAGMADPVRQIVGSLERDMPIRNLRTMESYYQMRTISTVRLLIQIVSGLGALGLILALIGLYGVMSYSVSRRTREIGVRIAIGADQSQILGMVLKQAAWIAGVGISVGLIASFFASGLLQAGFIGLADPHPLAFLIVPLLLFAVAIAAAYVPARRASLTAPTVALRAE